MSENKCGGSYFIIVYLIGYTEAMTGWVRNFKPTIEYPDIVSYIKSKFEEKHQRIECIRIADSESNSAENRWKGTYYPHFFGTKSASF